MQVLPPGSERERQNLRKLEKVAYSHFFDSQRPSLQGGLCHTGLQVLHYGKKTLLLLRCEHWRKACRNFLKRFVVKRAGGTVLPQFLQQFVAVFAAIMFHGVLHRTKRIRIQLPKHLRIS